MRSRYTAFVLERTGYLLDTWHPDTRPERLHLEPGLSWIGLEVRRVGRGGANDDEGTVEFVARSKRGGRAARLHETSRFVRVDERWLYLDGEHHAKADRSRR